MGTLDQIAITRMVRRSPRCAAASMSSELLANPRYVKSRRPLDESIERRSLGHQEGLGIGRIDPGQTGDLVEVAIGRDDEPSPSAAKLTKRRQGSR